MLKKVIKYAVWIIVIGFIAYNSIYIKKLSEVKAAETKPFNPREYARDYLYGKLPSSYKNAPQAGHLINELKANSSKAFAAYSYSPNEGDRGYFLVRGEGEIINIDESNVFVKLKTGEDIKLTTEYIFGNAVRDAAGLISMDEFSNSMDINNVSEEINKLIKTEVLPPFKSKAKKGDSIEFKGATELNQSALKLDKMEIIPVSITIKK